jgi:hypothetical protein
MLCTGDTVKIEIMSGYDARDLNEGKYFPDSEKLNFNSPIRTDKD